MTTVNDYRLICWALGAHVLLKDALSSKLGQMWVLAKEHLHQEALFFIFSIFKYACSASSFFFQNDFGLKNKPAFFISLRDLCLKNYLVTNYIII